MSTREHRPHSFEPALTREPNAWPASIGALARMWPWIGSLVAAAVVDLVIGAERHFDFTGIEGFSTTNYGWLAFSLVGGVGLGWRLAKPPGRWWLLVRPLVAPVLAFVACFVAVTMMGVLFLPSQPLSETLTTDAPGRSIWIGVFVVIGSSLCEAIRLVHRKIGRH